MLSEWAIVAVFFICCAAILGAGILGAWIGFRVRTVGTGMPFVQPGVPKADKEGVSSYVEDLFNKIGEPIYGENLSSAAQRIRDQRIKGPLADVIREVEGK